MSVTFFWFSYPILDSPNQGITDHGIIPVEGGAGSWTQAGPLGSQPCLSYRIPWTRAARATTSQAQCGFCGLLRPHAGTVS
jgi:hypothetical protein